MTIGKIESTRPESLSFQGPNVRIPEEILVLAERVRNYVNKEDKTLFQRVTSGVNLFQKKVSDYGTAIAIHDTAHSVFKAGAGFVKYIIEDEQTIDALDVASRVSGIVTGSINSVTKGIELKKAVEKLTPAFKYGDAIDKLDSLVALLRTLVNFLSTGAGLATSAAGKSVFSVAMKLPQLILKLISSIIWICRSTGRIIRILISLISINKALNHPDDKQKLLLAIEGFKRSTAEMDKFKAIAKEMHGESDELKKFLKERKSLRLSQEFGAYAEKRITSKYEKETTFEMLESDLNKIEQLKKNKTGDELNVLEAQEKAIIATGLGWIEEIRGEMKKNIYDTLPIFISSLLAVISIIVGLLVIPNSEIVASILGVLSLAAGTVFAGLGLLRTWEVQENQREWVKKIMVRHLVKEANAKNAVDKKEFMATYGFRDESMINFKKFLQEKVNSLNPKITLKFIETLKKYNQTVSEKKVTSVKQLTELREGFSKLFDELIVKDKERVSRERKLLPLIEGLANSSHLKAFAANFSPTFYKQHKIINKPV